MATKPSMSINLGLPAAPEVDSPELYGALLPVYNAVKNTMYAVDSYTGNGLITTEEYSQVNAYSQLSAYKINVMYIQLTETVTKGQIVNIWNSGGARGRKAVGGTSRGHAFALDSGVAGQHIPICFQGLCTLIGGLTPGSEYYLSVTAGAITPTATHHRVGTAIGPNHLWFSPT